MGVGGPWVSRFGGWFDGISPSPLRNAGYRSSFVSRSIGLSCVSMFGQHRSVTLLELYGPYGGFNAASSLDYTTVLSCLLFLLPTSLPFHLPPSLLSLLLSPLTCHPFSSPLHYSQPVPVSNHHITTVVHSRPNLIVVLTPISRVLLRRWWMAGGGDLGWPRNVQ